MRETIEALLGILSFIGSALFALLLPLEWEHVSSLHLCGSGTHRVVDQNWVADRRWCARSTGRRHGLYTEWYSHRDRDKRVEGQYEEGARTGPWRRWDPAGILRWEGEYRSDLPEGLWTYFHPNGQRWMRGAFRSGERDGQWTFWDREGEVVAQVGYDAGRQIAEEHFAAPAGQRALRALAGVRWSFPLECSPLGQIIVRDLAVASCNPNAVSGSAARVVAIDLETGREVWRRDLPSERGSLPASDGDHIYVTAGREVFALDSRTGELSMLFAMKERGMSHSTVERRGDLLYFCDRETVYALDLATRSLRWRYSLEDSADSPLIVAGGAVLVRSSKPPALHSIDASTGRRRWVFAASARNVGMAAVAVDRDTVYLGSEDVGRLHAIDLASGAERWSFTSQPAILTTPVVSGDSVFVGSGDGHVYVVERATGLERWRFDTAGLINTAVRAMDEVVFARSQNGGVFGFDRGDGQALWRYDTYTPWGTAPVPAPGIVVVTDDDNFLTALE